MMQRSFLFFFREKESKSKPIRVDMKEGLLIDHKINEI